MLLGRPPRSDPPPARPVGELLDGDRDGFGQPRQPPFVWTELLRVRLRSRQAATHHELADEVGEESAAPLRRAELSRLRASAIWAVVWPSSRSAAIRSISLSRSRSCS